MLLKNFYILKLDISKYFYSIDHEVLKSLLKDKLNKILSNNTNQPIEQIEQDTERDHFLSAKEAKNYGLIDKIIKKKK